jgi:hypothetical protein
MMSLIISNKATLQDAEPVKEEILALLPKDSKCSALEKYEKIPGCFKAEFDIYIDEKMTEADFNYNLLTLSSSMARPWMIWFQNNYGTELVLNRTEATSFNRQNLNTIIWGHIRVAP